LTVKVVYRADLDAMVVAVEGELDLDSAPMLRAVLEDALDRGETRIVVDVGGLRFCDSVGLSVLMTTHFTCTARGGYLRLAAPTDQLLHLLSVVGLAPYVIAYTSAEAAVRDDRHEIVTVPQDRLDRT
jgi:anti-sigma B factor antagonist